ncbi:hypothetical protein DMUE_5565 [Dictyocoela muelleri]|nr:hypothetical protein DMUE_5565 [Dictyocoela muelleri]
MFLEKKLVNHCVRRSCKGRVKTNLDASEIFKTIQHWHEEENSKLMRLEMNNKLKIMAEKNKDTFFCINICLSGVSENERQYLGNCSNIRDYFTKMRNKFAIQILNLILILSKHQDILLIMTCLFNTIVVEMILKDF